MSATEDDRAADQSIILAAVEKFCRNRLHPNEVQRRDEGHIPPYDLIPEMAELELIRAPFKPADGGLDLPWSSFCRIQERLGFHAYFAGSILNRLVCFGGMPIAMFGKADQRAVLLPQVLSGHALVALALSEPDVGSDARAVKMRARRTGQGWVLSGRKTWISDADAASHLLTLCRSNDGAQGNAELTAFLVPRRSAGIAMTEIPKVGNNCMPSFDIGFDDVTVADSDRLGAVGSGFEVVTGTLGVSRAGMSATAVGCAQAALELAMRHAKERVQFGRPIGEFQVIRHRLVDMRMEIEKARLLVRELARRIDADEPAGEIAAMAKIAATEALQFVTDHGMQILASAGYSSQSPMQRYWRDARLYTFGEGSSEIQREIVAREMGLR
jgi:alkylation response protein AidB-like acyl-CoA dehydrogenase